MLCEWLWCMHDLCLPNWSLGTVKLRECSLTTLLLGHFPGPASPAVRCGGGPPGDRGYRQAVPGYCEQDEGEIIRRLQDDEARKLRVKISTGPPLLSWGQLYARLVQTRTVKYFFLVNDNETSSIYIYIYCTEHVQYLLKLFLKNVLAVTWSRSAAGSSPTHSGVIKGG